MDQRIRRKIETAEAKALATHGPHGLNVVPITAAEIFGKEIHIYDFYMHKTAENIKAEPAVSLVCWAGFVGVQVKAVATYETDGPAYEAAMIRMRDRFPDRTLKAVVRLVPTAIYDVTPGGEADNLLGG